VISLKELGRGAYPLLLLMLFIDIFMRGGGRDSIYRSIRA
jgi:hypothetical protein